MRCLSCGEENIEFNAFCIFCGESLLVDSPDDETSLDEYEADRTADESSFHAFKHQIRALQLDIRRIQDALRQQGILVAGMKPNKQSSVVRPTTARREVTHVSSPTQTVLRKLDDTGYSDYIPFYRRIGMDWEVVIGGNWMARIGVLAVVIGMGFFLKMAFDRDWIDEERRVLLGILGGLAFLGAAEYWRRRYPLYAQALAGGGVALLYLSFFAAFSLFEGIGLYPGIGLLLLASVTSVALAIRYDSVALAVIGIFGAFVAPFVMGGFDQGVGANAVVAVGPSGQFMAYVITVDIGVLALSTLRNWRWLTLLALMGSLASFGSWYGTYSDEIALLTAHSSLTIIFLIFVAATTIFHVAWRRLPTAFDYSLMLINAAAYMAISYGLLWDDYRLWMGGFTLLISLFYGCLSYATLLRTGEHLYLSLMMLGIALVLLAIAVPAQLGGPWVSVAWAAQGTVLIWLSLTLRMWHLRLFSLSIFAILVLRLLAFNTAIDLDNFQIFLNYRMLAFASAVGALYISAYLLTKTEDLTYDWESAVVPVLLAGANFLTLWVFSFEMVDTVDSEIVKVTGQAAYYVKSLSLSLLWAIYAVAALVLGIFRRWRMVRLASLCILAIPILKLFLVDSFQLGQGYRIVAFLALGCILLVGGFLYQRYSAAIKGFLFEDQASSARV